MPPPKFVENIVILCFERRFSKQNSVIHLKLNIWYTMPNTDSIHCQKLFIHFLFLGSEGRAMAQWSPPPFASVCIICKFVKIDH